ncbi:acyl carrier protein [Amycolatopsis lurida]
MSGVPVALSDILTSSFDVPADEIEPGKILDDLGVDSVAVVELADLLQEKFGIRIGEDELTNKNTIEQVVSTVTAKAGA